MKSRTTIIGRRTKPSSLMTSGLLIGKIAELLRVKGALEGKHFSRTARRYFAGTPTNPDDISKIIQNLLSPIISNKNDEEDLRGLVLSALRRWDQYVSLMKSNAFPVDDNELEPIPVIRFLVLDAALRWGAYKFKQQRSGELTPEIPYGLAEGSVKELVELYRLESGKLTNEQLCLEQNLSVTSFHSWLSEEVSPEDMGISTLARTFAKFSQQDFATIRFSLRFAFGISAARKALQNHFGPKKVRDWIETLRLLSELAVGFFADLDEILDSELHRIVKEGADCRSGKAVADQLSRSLVLRSHVKEDLVALGGSWELRIQYWCDLCGKTNPLVLKKIGGAIAGQSQMHPDDIREIVSNLVEWELQMSSEPPRNAELDQLRTLLPTPPDVQASIAIEKAIRALSSGDLQDGYEQLLAVVRKFPNEPMGHYRLGAFFKEEGDRHAFDSDPRCIDLFNEALFYFERALKVDSTFHPALHEKGVVLGNLGLYADALAVLYEVHALEPTWEPAVEAIGECLCHQGRIEEGLEWFEKHLEMNSTAPRTWERKASWLYKLGRKHDANAAEKEARLRGGKAVLSNELWLRIITPYAWLKKFESSSVQ